MILVSTFGLSHNSVTTRKAFLQPVIIKQWYPLILQDVKAKVVIVAEGRG